MSIISNLSNVFVSSNRSKKKYKAIEDQYRAHAHPKVFHWNWRERNFNRIALVNLLIANTKGWDSNYLEIGCASNSLFDSVAAKHKVGVDSAEGGTHRMTSDEFFRLNNENYDVIFIDGQHEYLQVRKDALNALDCAEEGGWIAFHDLLPSSWKEHHVPRLQKVWTGDCWKLAVELIQAKGVEFKILEIDYGVGLLKKTSSEWSVPDLSEYLLKAEFELYVEELDTFPIISFEDAVSYIKEKTKVQFPNKK
jgi:hypothetical protein